MSRKKREKKRYSNRAKVLIIINLVIILGLTGFYSYRLFYFYHIEHPEVLSNHPIVDFLDLENATVTSGDGIYKDDNNTYYYKGNVSNNYVMYSHRLWRIVSVDAEYNVKLISADNATYLYYGNETNFKDSEVYKYLNNANSLDGSYYSSLDHSDYLNKTNSQINDIVDGPDNLSSNIGLLSYEEYQRSGKNSYLKGNNSWWISNTSNGLACYIDKKGQLKELEPTMVDDFILGVRPTITIKGSVNAFTGSGSANDPINLDKDNKGKTIGDKGIGSYVTYNGSVWRIIGKDDNGVKIMSNDLLMDNNNQNILSDYGSNNYYSLNNGIGAYLNSTYYNSLKNPGYLLSFSNYNGGYDYNTNYELNNLDTYTETVKVSLPRIGDLFIDTCQDYYLSTRSSLNYSDIYYINQKGNVNLGVVSQERNLRIVVYLDKTIEVKRGHGFKDEPYVIE